MKDSAYAAAFRKAQTIAADLLEAEAVRRAVEGWRQPVFFQGRQCGSVWRYDSGLLQFLLRGLLPQRYGSQKTEISEPQRAQSQVNVKVNFAREEIERAPQPAQAAIEPVDDASDLVKKLLARV